MDANRIDYLLNNQDSDRVYHQDLKLAPFSKIMSSRIVGNMFIGRSSCLNRCSIGRYVGIAYFSYLADTHAGNYCTFGSRVSIGAFSHPTNYLTVHEVGYRNTIDSYNDTILEEDSEDYLKTRSEKTVIGNDIWVGDNAVILKGVKIGNGAVVAAGSIVTKDVASFSIVAGSPARTIRKRFPEAVIAKIEATRWWEYSMQELRDIPFVDVAGSISMLEKLNSRTSK